MLGKMIGLIFAVGSSASANEAGIWQEACSQPKTVYVKREACGRVLFQGLHEVYGHIDGSLRLLPTGTYRFGNPVCEFKIKNGRVDTIKDGDTWIQATNE